MRKIKDELINHYINLLRISNSEYYYKLKINYLNHSFSKNINTKRNNIFKLDKEIEFESYFKILIKNTILDNIEEKDVLITFAPNYDSSSFISIFAYYNKNDIELILHFGEMYNELHITRIAVIDLNEDYMDMNADSNSITINTRYYDIEKVIEDLIDKVYFIENSVSSFNLSLINSGFMDEDYIFYLEEIENTFNIRKNSIIEELSESEIKKYKVKEGLK